MGSLPEGKLGRIRAILFGFLPSNTLELDELRKSFEILLIDCARMFFENVAATISYLEMPSSG